MPEAINNTSEKLEMPSRRRFFRGRVQSKQEMRLPWVINEAVFTSGCTQCQDCITHCETNIIVKDEDGYPKVDFSRGECTFCNKCIDACEQPLFSGEFLANTYNLDESPKPWPVSLEINDKCLAKNNIYCQSCRDECETSVIKFSYVDSSIPVPSLDDNDCNQCGACIKSCPQDAIAFTFETNKTNSPRESL